MTYKLKRIIADVQPGLLGLKAEDYKRVAAMYDMLRDIEAVIDSTPDAAALGHKIETVAGL